MAYHDLSALLDGSPSSRSYFLSLPVKMQLQLHQREELIHTAEDLHRLGPPASPAAGPLGRQFTVLSCGSPGK